MNVAQSVARKMIVEKHPGSIVNVSSQASMRALEGHTIYASSKAAVDMMTKIMALELGKHNASVYLKYILLCYYMLHFFDRSV